MRIVAKKILPFEFASKYFDLRKWFQDLYNLMNKKEYIFERQIREMHYAALCNGEEFFQWFEDTIYKMAMKEEPCPEPLQLEASKEDKHYKSGVTADGTFILDASKYGVKNIYQAVILTEKISNY